MVLSLFLSGLFTCFLEFTLCGIWCKYACADNRDHCCVMLHLDLLHTEWYHSVSVLIMKWVVFSFNVNCFAYNYKGQNHFHNHGESFFESSILWTVLYIRSYAYESVLNSRENYVYYYLYTLMCIWISINVYLNQY